MHMILNECFCEKIQSVDCTLVSAIYEFCLTHNLTKHFIPHFSTQLL